MEREAGKKGMFLPDRIVGGIGGAVFGVGYLVFAALWAVPILSSMVSPFGITFAALPFLLYFLFMLAVTLALLGLVVWTYAQVFQGRRVGLIIMWVLGATGFLGAMPAAGRDGRFGYAEIWSGLLLLYAAARLVGWGPRPE